MNATYVATGTLTDGKTVVLDELLPAVAGKVRVTVEIEPSAMKQTLQEWLDDLRRRRDTEGVRQLTDTEIEEWVEDVRTGRGN